MKSKNIGPIGLIATKVSKSCSNIVDLLILIDQSEIGNPLRAAKAGRVFVFSIQLLIFSNCF